MVLLHNRLFYILEKGGRANAFRFIYQLPGLLLNILLEISRRQTSVLKEGRSGKNIFFIYIQKYIYVTQRRKIIPNFKEYFLLNFTKHLHN